MVLKEVTYGWWFSLGPWPWPVAVVCRVLMVTFQLIGLKVHVRVLCQCHGVRWKLVQTGVSSSPSGEGVLWAGLHRWFSGWIWCWGWAWWWSRWVVPWGWWWGWCWGCLDVCLVHQTTWTWCPYSWFPSGKTQIWPCWADGLERNCLWAVSSLFSPDGLERRSCHNIWASNELCSLCGLCCWGPGSCRIVPHSNISVTVPVIHLMGSVPCLLWKNWTCSLTLRIRRQISNTLL